MTIILRFRLSVVVNTPFEPAIWHQQDASFLSRNEVPSGGWDVMSPDDSKFMQVPVVWMVQAHESTSS
jgi:hypothetical protein